MYNNDNNDIWVVTGYNMYAAYTMVYQYIYVYFNCRPMFWVTQKPLLRVHSSSGRCARQRSRLASPRKQHKFWQKIAFICRFNMNSLNTLGNHKQASKVNLSSWKPTTLPSCLPLPPYPSQDPSNNSSSGKILFVFLRSAQFVLWKHSCDQFHYFGLESTQSNTKSRWHVQQFNHAVNSHQLPSNLHWDIGRRTRLSRSQEKRLCHPDLWRLLGWVSAKFPWCKIICRTAKMILGMNPMQHGKHQPQSGLRDFPKLPGFLTRTFL